MSQFFKQTENNHTLSESCHVSAIAYGTSTSEKNPPDIYIFLSSIVITMLNRISVWLIVSCSFQYIDPPEERMILEALKQLYYFGALDR